MWIFGTILVVFRTSEIAHGLASRTMHEHAWCVRERHGTRGSLIP